MIQLTRLSGADIIINAELVETVEETPDTVVTLTTGKKYVVRDTASEVVRKVLEYRRALQRRRCARRAAEQPGTEQPSA